MLYFDNFFFICHPRSFLVASVISRQVPLSHRILAFCSNFRVLPMPFPDCRICVFVHVMCFQLPAAGFFVPRFSPFKISFSECFLPPIIHLFSPLKCVLNISWDDCYTQEKLKTKVLQNLAGKQEGRRAKNELYLYSRMRRKLWWLNLAGNLVPRASPLLQPFRSRPGVLCVSFIRAMVNGCFFVSNYPRSLWYNNVTTGVFNWISGALHSRLRGNYERGKQRNNNTGKNGMTSSIG